MLLYLVKHSRPDIANATRELARAMDGSTEAAWKELLRVIQFVLTTRDYGLVLKPDKLSMEGKWSLVIYSDSDWAGDVNERKSTSGYILYLMDAPIVWKSKGQTSVALSSAEAEYYAITEAAKEIKFVIQLLKSMGFEVETPVTVFVDNIGAIYMTENEVSSNRTKHIDIRYHFI